MPRPNTGPYSVNAGLRSSKYRSCDKCGKPTLRAEGGYVAIDKYHQRWVCNDKCKPVLEQKQRDAA